MSDRLVRFVRLLRSGQLQQVKRVLRHSGCYCVEGAMCHFYEQETGDKLASSEWKHYSAPRRVFEWLGMNPIDMYSADDGSRHTLMGLNDAHSYSFQQLADEIERKYL